MGKHFLPKGFLANGIHCGMKKKRKDLAVFFSLKPCNVAALFTTNTVKAAPVIVAEEQLAKRDTFRAVVVNSGNANCMTGKQGIEDAKKTARTAAKLLGVDENDVLVSSTGIIGQTMNMDAMLPGLEQLMGGLSTEGLETAAEGIMTTDRFNKIASRTFTVGKKTITITGVAKGAGMIKPEMATMLCFILTDAAISKDALKKAARSAIDDTFNSITVDGDMSTNDTVLVMANGEAANARITEKSGSYETFRKNLEAVAKELAKLVVRDGEGASKLIEVHVMGARYAKDARKIANSIAGSLLVKCAVLGGDPNWGRIASSAGASRVKFDPEKMEIILGGVTFFKNGKPVQSIDRKTIAVFRKEDVLIEVDLHSGKHEATVFSCDISKKYIAFNSFYTT